MMLRKTGFESTEPSGWIMDIIYTTAAFHMVTFFFDLERRFTKMQKSFTVKSTHLRVIVGDAGFEPQKPDH